MNYAGLETLRANISVLCNDMCDIRTQLNHMESEYNYDADTLVERLAGQTLRRINMLFLEAYREVLVLDETFQD